MARCFLLMTITLVACGGGDRAHDAAVGPATRTIDSSSPPYLDDPGPPASYFGPKCVVAVEGVAMRVPECLSAPMDRVNGRTHLFLNFCMANGEDRCRGMAGGPRLYVSLVLSTPDWQEGTTSEAVRGRIDLRFPDGSRYVAGATAEVPLPLSYIVANQNHPTDKQALRAQLVVTVPRVDRVGDPVTLRASIN